MGFHSGSNTFKEEVSKPVLAMGVFYVCGLLANVLINMAGVSPDTGGWFWIILGVSIGVYIGANILTGLMKNLLHVTTDKGTESNARMIFWILGCMSFTLFSIFSNAVLGCLMFVMIFFIAQALFLRFSK